MRIAAACVRVGDLFPRIKIGGTPPRGNPRYFGGPHVWVSIRDMEGQSIITTSNEQLSDHGVSNSNCKLVPKGSLLFSFKLTVGRVAFAGTDLYTNEAIAAFDLEDAASSDVDLEYLSLVLPPIARLDTTKNSMGVAMLNKEKISNLFVPLPPIGEQRRIAARLKAQLGAVEDARQAAQSQAKEVECLEAAMVEAAFSEAPEATETWIGDVASVQSGYAFKSTDFKTSGLRLLRNTNVLPGRVYWDDAVFIAPDVAADYERFALNDGDVLISLDRPIISSGIKVARIGATDVPSLLVQRVGRFQIDKQRLNGDYLYAYMRSRRFIEAITGHDQSLGVPHVSPSQIEEIEVPLPPIEEQRRIVRSLDTKLEAVEQMRLGIRARLADLERLPARLLAEAFHSSNEETLP